MKWYRFSLILLTIFIVSPLNVSGAKDAKTVQLYKQWKAIPSEILEKMASECEMSNHTDSAVTAYTILANRYNADKGHCPTNHIAAHAMRRMGYIYQYVLYDYSLAYLNMQKCLEISEKENYKDNIPYIYLHYANIAYNDCLSAINSDPYGKTMPLYRKALEAAASIHRWDMYLNIMGNVFSMAFECRHSSHNQELKKLLYRSDIDTSTPLYRHMRATLDALIATNEGRDEDALNLLNTAEKLSKELTQPHYYMMRTLRHQAIVYKDMHRYDEALQCLQKRLSLAQRYHIEDVRVQTYRLIAKLFYLQGDSATAMRWQMTYYQQKDTFIRSSHLLRVDRLQFSDMLAKANQEKNQLAHRHQLEVIALGINYFILALLVLLIILLTVNYRKLRQKNKALYNSTQKILQREESSKRERDKMNKILEKEKNEMPNPAEPTPSHEVSDEERKYKSSTLTDQDKLRIYNKLIDVMNHSREIFSPDFTIHQLSELTGISGRSLSQVINERCGYTFKTLLTRYRIREACHRLGDSEHYGHLSIEGIADSVGFKSRSSFVQAFKRETGLSPSDYQKEALK